MTTLTLAEPLTAVALATVVLGERLGAVGLAGTALILAGLALLCVPIRWAFRRRGRRSASIGRPKEPVPG